MPLTYGQKDEQCSVVWGSIPTVSGGILAPMNPVSDPIDAPAGWSVDKTTPIARGRRLEPAKAVKKKAKLGVFL